MDSSSASREVIQRNTELHVRLKRANSDIISVAGQLRESILQDHDDYPVYAPTFSADELERQSKLARIAVADAVRDIFFTKKEDVAIPSAFLCASPTTLSLVSELNAAKLRLKAAVAAIKDGSAFQNSRGFRTEDLRQAMRLNAVGAVDLKRVYAQLKILPPDVQRLSWTWARNHTACVRLSREKVEDRVEKLEMEDPSAASAARIALSHIDDTDFQLRKPLPDQLRINFTYQDSGVIHRSSGPVSGVLFAGQRSLPLLKWKDQPENESVGSQGRAREPLIGALNIYQVSR